MPSWLIHEAGKRGRSKKIARKVNELLDKPVLVDHFTWRKITHTPFGVALSLVLYGEEGALYAVEHILLDELFSMVKKRGRR